MDSMDFMVTDKENISPVILRPVALPHWGVRTRVYTVHNMKIMYGPTSLVITLKGTPNLYFSSEVLTISTG